MLEANASRYHGKPPEELDWTDKQSQRCLSLEIGHASTFVDVEACDCRRPRQR